MTEQRVNGRKTEIQESEETDEPFLDPGNLGKNGSDCGSTKHQSQRVGGEMDASMGANGLLGIVGGVLSLLREVAKEGLEYIDSHGERLETRLIEHSQKRASYLEKTAALEREIARLLEQAEKLPTNPTEEE
nr:hypothetical protein [Okeania sp. SIO3B5]